MQNRIRLISGRVPTTNSINLTDDRYVYLDLASAEPNLGISIDGNILSYDSATLGGRKWITQESITQTSFNVANSASANTIIIQGVDLAQNSAISIIQGVDSTQNTRLDSIEGIDIDQYNLISILVEVDSTQNTRLNSIETVNVDQNTTISIIQGVDLGQNTRLNSIETINTDQNNAISIIQGVDLTQNTRLNSIETINTNQNTSISIIQGTDNTQNTRLNSIETVNVDQNTSIGIIQGTDDTQNTRLNSIETVDNNQNTSIAIIQGVDLTQNTNITAVNQFTQSAYNSANTNATNLTYLNSYAESAYAKANTNALDIISVNQYAGSGYDLANTNAINLSSNVGLQFGINATQNTQIAGIQGVDLAQNTAISIIQTVNNTQNTRLNSIETVNTNQNNAITIIQGVDVTQNTQIAGIQGVDLAQNTAISIIQGVDETQNVRIGYIEAINTDQNTAITIIQGVDLGQNATITAVNQFAQSSYDTANTKLNSSGGTITGSLNINNDLTVSGNLSVLGNTFAVSANTLEVKDSLITLGVGNYTSDIIDIGFAGHYNDGTNAHTGLIRDAGNKEWYLFQGYTPIINGNNNIDINNSSFQTSNLNAGFVKGNLIGTTVSVNGLDVTSVFNTQNNTTIAVNQYAGAAYTQANVTIGVDATQNTRLDSIETINTNQNNAITIIQGVNLTQNTEIQGLQGVDLAQNSAISIIQGVDLGQNATITAVNQFAQSAYDTANGANGLAAGAYNQANVTIGVDATQNTRLDSIETINVDQNTAISIIQGVDLTQNTRLNSIETVNANQNTAIGIIQGVNDGQNTTITYVNQYAGAAYNQANVTIGVDATQNTRLDSIETVNVNQNTSIAIIQGVDLTQNTNITAVNQYAISGYTHANNAYNYANTVAILNDGINATQNTRLDSIETINTDQNTAIVIIQGVNDSQNTSIIEVNQYAASAFNKANVGGTFTGNVIVQQNLTVNKDLLVSGNLIISGNATTISASNLVIDDPIVVLANNNTLDAFDIGYVGHYNEFAPGEFRHTGIIRHAEDNEYYIFYNYDQHVHANVGANNIIDVLDPSFLLSNVNAGYYKGNLIADTAVIGGIDITNYISVVQGVNNTQNTRLNSIETVNNNQNTSITQVNQYAASAYNQANTNLGNISIIQGVDLTQNTRLNSIETINTNQNTTITAVNQFTQSAYDTANNKLDLSGGVVHGDITSNNLTANVAVISPELRSTGGTTHVYTSDIGIVAIDVGGGQTKFYNAGVEVPGDVYAGTYGGNRVSLAGNEAKLQSIRTATVQIQTGTDGSVSNTWTFNGNQIIFPDNSVQNTAFTGVALDQFVRDVANSASANTIVTQGVDAWQNNAIIALQNSLITINANSAFSSAVDATQNTRLDSIETINTNQNTAIGIIQGVNLTQNTNITIANNAAGLTTQVQFNDGGVRAGSSLFTFDKNSGILSAQQVNVTNSIGDEGGEIQLAKPQTNSTIGGTGVVIDIYQNKLRFFEEGGSSRGAYIDLTSTAGSVGTNLLTPSSGISIDQVARDTANSAVTVNNNQNTNITQVNQFTQSAYDKANNALPLTGGTLTGPLVISNNNDLTVTGNLYILGNTTSISANTLEVKDSMIMLGIGNYTTDIVDIGFAGHYNAGTNAHAGLIRDAGNKEWYLFQGYTPALGGNNNINIADASFSTSNLNASYVKGNLIATTASVNGFDVTSVFNTQNTAISIIQGVNLGQNATITAVNQFAQAAYNQANTALTSGIDTYARNTANLAIGIDATQNTQIAVIQGVDLGQNATITAVNQFTQSAYNTANGANGLATGAFNLANTQTSQIAVIQGVDLGQNTTITNVNQFAAAAFNQANTANTRAYNSVLKTGDTMTGALNITSALVGTTWGNGALNVNGNIVSNNAVYFGGSGSFGTANGANKFANALLSAIGNSTSYAQAVLQNGNSGVGSSTDFVATADNGTDADTYIDMGINSSSYNQVGFGLTGPNDGYLYVSGNTSTGGGNLVLSTFTPKDIVFSLNGGDTGNEYARFQYNTGLKLKNLPLTFADGTSQNTAYNPGSAIFANAAIAVIQGVDATQNTRLNAVETININQNTSIGIIQGVDATQNTRLNSIETININQNTSITQVNQFAQAAYNKANTGTPAVVYLANTVLVANTNGYISNSSMIFTSSNNNLYISGNVGIGAGKTTPSTALDVSGTVTATAFSGSGSSLTGLTAGNLSGTIPSAVLGNSTHYIGTTAIALNRGSASQTLTGVSIDGNAATATTLQTARTISGVSFNGSANITLNTSGITENTNLYYTDARVRAALSFVAGSGAYNSTTGAITIPTNTNQLTNGAGFLTAEADTLATVTNRGNITTGNISTPASEGTGYSFWGDTTNYKISMGVTAGLYQYGPVTDYSIKTQMDAASPNRGFTWGGAGAKPTASLSVSGNMQIAGTFSAASKSFLIPHPTKEGKQLRYGSLESPYHGVRLTGEATLTGKVCRVDLPDYIHGLCKQEGSQVQITNIKHGKVLWVENINVDQDYFEVSCNRGLFDNKAYSFYWSFTAVRKDIEDMEVEID